VYPLIGILLVLAAGVPTTPPRTRCESASVSRALSIQADWFAYEERHVTIVQTRLTDRCWIARYDLEKAESVGCLAPRDFEILIDSLGNSEFFDMPEDVSSPPFYVDEATAVLEIDLDGRHHSVRASGLDRASTKEALRFREVWNLIIQLADELSTACAPPPNPSLQRTQGNALRR
jgi:hypothetical protein